MFDHHTDVLHDKDACFIVSHSTCLPILQWNRETLHFSAVQDTSLAETVRCQVREPSGTSSSQVKKCIAIYGVLQMGEVCVLLVVTNSEKVGKFSVSDEVHDVFLVKQMKSILLPTPLRTASEKDCASEESFYAASNAPGMSDLGSHSRSAAKVYSLILSSFFRSIENDQSYFYYSSTINLAHHHSDILSFSSPSDHEETFTASVGRRRIASAGAFQWNYMLLLRHFEFPPKTQLCEKSACECEKCPHRSPCVTQQCFRSMDPFSESIGNHTLFSGCSATHLLYAPGFIRGFFGSASVGAAQSYVITRLCCQWSGTRFNRRGLEPGSSGVCANMAISSVWVVEGDGSGKHTCVFDLVRGSIPRRWEQRANLRIWPPIRFPSKGATDTAPLQEISLHIQMLSNVLSNPKYVLCIDATANSKKEAGLSKAYQTAVKQYQEDTEHNEGLKERHLPALFYLKTCVGSLVLKRFYPFTSVTQILLDEAKEVFTGDEHDWLQFTQWSPSGGFTACQSLYFRVNCVDCVDRTNIVQSCLTAVMTERMQKALADTCSPLTSTDSSRLIHKTLGLIKDQSFAIAHLYSGTGHHLKHYPIRGRVLPHDMIMLTIVMLRRWYQQNFGDGRKQDEFSLLTLQHCPEGWSIAVDHALALNLSRMNRYVFYGFLISSLPCAYSVLAFFLAGEARKYHALFSGIWIAFLFFVWAALRNSRESLTNRPLLGYGR